MDRDGEGWIMKIGRLIFTLNFIMPSYNHLYWHRGNMKILKKEARILREKIIYEVKKQAAEQDFEKINWDNKKLRLVIAIYENWLTKKGEIKRKDILNKEKFLNDSIFEALDLEDKFIWEHTMIKMQEDDSNKIKSIVEIEEYEI